MMNNVVILNGVFKGLERSNVSYLGHRATHLSVETGPDLASKLPRRPKKLRTKISNGAVVHHVMCLDELAERVQKISRIGATITIRGDLRYIAFDDENPSHIEPVIVAHLVTIQK